MVFYFSGTGNSQLAAIQIAEAIGDEVVSINYYLKEGKKAVFRSEKPLVFVVPTYSWRIPKVAEQWIRQADFQGCQDTYFVLTCGGSIGNAAVYAKRLCTAKGLRFRGVAGVPMPENYLALNPTPDEAECQAIVSAARPHLDGLAKLIAAGEPFPVQQVSFTDKVKSGPINPLFYALYVHDKGFSTSSACTSCGKCAQRCPLNNIDLAGGKPVWKGTCTHCMACIGGCPAEAIEYKNVSKGRHRHYLMDDSRCQKDEGQRL